MYAYGQRKAVDGTAGESDGKHGIGTMLNTNHSNTCRDRLDGGVDGLDRAPSNVAVGLAEMFRVVVV